MARAVPAVHAVPAEAFHQLFHSLVILAVPVSVNVPSTYTAYQAGFSSTPVFTVRLL